MNRKRILPPKIRERSSEEYSPMEYLLCYYHMNWIDDERFMINGTIEPDNVILAFIDAEQPALVLAVLHELQGYLAVHRDESELRRLLDSVDANLRPAGLELTIQQWLEHVRNLIAQHIEH